MKITDAGNTVVLQIESAEEKQQILKTLNQKKQTRPTLITRKQAADILGVCAESVKRYEKKGLVRAIRFTARRLRYDEAEIIDFANNGVQLQGA